MKTPSVAKDLLRHLLDVAPEEVRTAFRVAPGRHDFLILAALLRGVRTDSDGAPVRRCGALGRATREWRLARGRPVVLWRDAGAGRGLIFWPIDALIPDQEESENDYANADARGTLRRLDRRAGDGMDGRSRAGYGLDKSSSSSPGLLPKELRRYERGEWKHQVVTPKAGVLLTDPQ
jgi:hypothetical protein